MSNDNKPTIIIADDYPLNRELYRRFFELEGFQVVTVEDGLKLLELSLREQPDVILTDVNMPEMSGIDAVKALKCTTATKDIPVFVHSANPYNRAPALVAGAEGFFDKPSVFEALVSAVRRAIGR